MTNTPQGKKNIPGSSILSSTMSSLKSLGLKIIDPTYTPEEKDKKKTRTKQVKVDNRRIDYRYAQDDPFLFIKGQSVWTGVILGTTSDDFASYLEEEQQVRQNVELWKSLSVHYANHYNINRVQFHLITRYMPADVSRWETHYINNMWNPTQLFNDLIKEKVSPHLAESTPERRQYLFLRLGDFHAEGVTDPVSALLGKSAGVAEELFTQRDLDPFRERAMGIHSLLASHGAIPMERADLAWVIRKTLMGHFPADNGRNMERTRPWRGAYFDEIVNAGLDNDDYCVRIRNPHPGNGLEDYSYTTTLTVENVSPVIRYEYSSAWGKKLRSMPRPVDVSWRGTIISAEEWKKASKRSIKIIEDEAQERAATGAAESAAFNQKYEMADTIKQQNEIQPQPVLVSQQRLTFSAPSQKELMDIVGELQSLFNDDTKLEQFNGAQGFLLEEQLPGDMTEPEVGLKGLGKVILNDLTGSLNDGSDRWTGLQALSFARLDSSPSVGDEISYQANGKARGWRGIPIGYTVSNGAVVHFDPIVQMVKNSGAGTIIIGSSGGGKSSLSLMLFFWASESGTQCIVIDPKDDFQNFIYYLAFGAQTQEDGFWDDAQNGTLGTPQSQFQPICPNLWAETSLIHLGNGAPGMLDPWAITDDYNTGEAAARDIVKLVFDKQDHDALDIAFQAMREDYENTNKTPSLADLPHYLNDEIKRYQKLERNDDGNVQMSARDRLVAMRRVHNALIRAASRPFGRLMFAPNADTQPFEIGNKRRVIITLLGLQMPDDNSPVEQWDDNTRDAAAALLSAIRQLSRLFSLSKDEYSPWQQRRGRRPRLLFVDEAYFITAFRAGRTMLNVFLRQGRSRYFGVIFISQQAKDVNVLNEEAAKDDDASTNQFPTKFVFRQNGLSEARDAMKLLRASLAESDPTAMSQLSQQLLRPQDGGYMSTGRCVMSDADGRVSLLQVDRLFNELVRAAETNPGKRTESHSENMPAIGTNWTIDTTTRDLLRTGIIVTEIGEVREALHRIEYDEFQFLKNT